MYNHDCTGCKLHRGMESVCEPGFGPKQADIMVVSKLPNSKRYQDALEEDLAQAGVDLRRVWFASALKCRNFEANASNADVKACRQYLDAEIAMVKPKYILTFGNEALLATTGHSGITKYRGRPVEKDGYIVFPTISPNAVLARPQNRPSYQADLKFFSTLVSGQQIDSVEVIPAKVIETKRDLAQLMGRLKRSTLIAFDIETNIVPLQEFDPCARVISMCGTYMVDGELLGFKLPLFHPESPWRTTWRSVLRHLVPIMAKIKIRIAFVQAPGGESLEFFQNDPGVL